MPTVFAASQPANLYQLIPLIIAFTLLLGLTILRKTIWTPNGTSKPKHLSLVFDGLYWIVLIITSLLFVSALMQTLHDWGKFTFDFLF